MNLLRLHRLPGISRAQFHVGGCWQGPDNRMYGLVINEYAPTRRHDLSRKMILRGRKNGGQARAFAHTDARLLRLMAAEDVLETMDVEEQINGALAKARAAASRHAKASGVKLSTIFLLR